MRESAKDLNVKHSGEIDKANVRLVTELADNESVDRGKKETEPEEFDKTYSYTAGKLVKETLDQETIGFLSELSREVVSLLDFYKLLDEAIHSGKVRQEDAFRIYDESLRYKLLARENFDRFVKVLKVEKAVEHDLNNLCTTVFGFVQKMQEMMQDVVHHGQEFNPVEFTQLVSIIRNGLPPCIAVVEDIMAREHIKHPEREPDFFSLHSRPVNLKRLPDVVRTLVDTSMANKRMRDSAQRKIAFYFYTEILHQDEEVVSVPGIIAEELAAMTANACQERPGHKAKFVILNASRENNTLVLRVIDNGGGMSKQEIDERNPGSIWHEKVSNGGNGNTGYGLAYAPERIRLSRAGEKQAELVCFSRKSKESGGDGQWHASNEGGADGIEGLEEDIKAEYKRRIDAIKNAFSVSCSTIFEIRLLITKKPK